jgi:DHHC palmitoyltransferase
MAVAGLRKMSCCSRILRALPAVITFSVILFLYIMNLSVIFQARYRLLDMFMPKLTVEQFQQLARQDERWFKRYQLIQQIANMSIDSIYCYIYASLGAAAVLFFLLTMYVHAGKVPSFLDYDRRRRTSAASAASAASATQSKANTNAQKYTSGTTVQKNKKKTSLRQRTNAIAYAESRDAAVQPCGTRSQQDSKSNTDSDSEVAVVHTLDAATIPRREGKRNGCRRYCRKCLAWKADRTHHCSTCHECVLTMDHHCIFVNNCVGHGNYKYFMLFLIYVSIACTFGSFVIYRIYWASTGLTVSSSV